MRATGRVECKPEQCWWFRGMFYVFHMCVSNQIAIFHFLPEKKLSLYVIRILSMISENPINGRVFIAWCTDIYEYALT